MITANKIILLKNISYVDVINDNCISYVDILIKNGLIHYIGNINTDIDAIVIDCHELWAIPSFIDMHVHLDFNSYAIEDQKNTYILANLVDAANEGICLVRDLGMKEDINRLNDTIYPTPEIVTSGSPICVRNGHGSYFGNVVPYNELNNWIMNHKAQGYKWIKIMNDPERHSSKYLGKLSYLAHKHGLMVACHAFTNEGIKDAIHAQFDTIEHSVPFSQDLIALSSNIYYVPTLYSAYVSKQKHFLEKISPEEAQYLLDWFEILDKNLLNAIQNGATILCGTDGGYCPSTCHDITSEIIMLNKYGLNNMEAIKSATSVAAKCLQKDEIYGSIDTGKYANLLISKVNPIEDINALRYKEFIILRGHFIRDGGQAFENKLTFTYSLGDYQLLQL